MSAAPTSNAHMMSGVRSTDLLTIASSDMVFALEPFRELPWDIYPSKKLAVIPTGSGVTLNDQIPFDVTGGLRVDLLGHASSVGGNAKMVWFNYSGPGVCSAAFVVSGASPAEGYVRTLDTSVATGAFAIMSTLAQAKVYTSQHGFIEQGMLLDRLMGVLADALGKVRQGTRAYPGFRVPFNRGQKVTV